MLTECPQCRYSLAGLPANHRCPECGFRYDDEMHVHHRAVPPLYIVGVVFLVFAFGNFVFGVMTGGGIRALLAALLLLAVGIALILFSRAADRRNYIAISPVRIAWRFRRESADLAWEDIEAIRWSGPDGRLVFDLADEKSLSVPSPLILPSRAYQHLHAMIERWRDERGETAPAETDSAPVQS